MKTVIKRRANRFGPRHDGLGQNVGGDRRKPNATHGVRFPLHFALARPPRDRRVERAALHRPAVFPARQLYQRREVRPRRVQSGQPHDQWLSDVALVNKRFTRTLREWPADNNGMADPGSVVVPSANTDARASAGGPRTPPTVWRSAATVCSSGPGRGPRTGTPTVLPT